MFGAAIWLGESWLCRRSGCSGTLRRGPDRDFAAPCTRRLPLRRPGAGLKSSGRAGVFIGITCGPAAVDVRLGCEPLHRTLEGWQQNGALARKGAVVAGPAHRDHSGGAKSARGEQFVDNLIWRDLALVGEVPDSRLAVNQQVQGGVDQVRHIGGREPGRGGQLDACSQFQPIQNAL